MWVAGLRHCSTCPERFGITPLPFTHPPPPLQVRKYVYCDVVRTQDVQRYVDLSGVQTYIINGARVAFLNPNPRRRAVKGPTTCVECRAATREGCNYW